MSDLISRKAVIDWFRCYGHMDEPIPFETLVSDLRDAIPSVDAAPVVYCKDCNNFGHNFENETYCKSVNGLADPEEDDFCSYSERKDSADNE